MVAFLLVAARELCKVSPANIKVGSEEPVYVTSVTDSTNFFCQLAKTSIQLDKLMNSIAEQYECLQDDENCYIDPYIGEVCCAMFTEDDGWYRAVVTKVAGQNLGVCYLDYGNSEVLPLSRIKILQPSFTGLSAQGFQASLVGDMELSKSEFESTIGEKELVARVVCTSDVGYKVEVLDSDTKRPLFGGAAASRSQGKHCENLVTYLAHSN